jgi:hypothetical protein
MDPHAIDPTAEFFGALAAKGYEPLLANASGTVRIDVVDPEGLEHWHVDIQKGNVSVSRRNRRADVVVRVDRALCDAITCGRQNAMAAMLRGELVPEGDLRLVMLFQRLFPGPGGEGSQGSEEGSAP